MKFSRHFYLLLGMLCLASLFISCKDDDDGTPPLEQLPEATQTGRGIFGALVNGEAFVETGTFFNTFYQQIDGEFFFGIQGEFDNKNPSSITIGTTSKSLTEGETLVLADNIDGNAWAECSFQGIGNSGTTSELMTGQLTITKLDFQSNVISGFFWFDVVDPNTNDKIEIREGRFDTLFTQ